MVNEKKNKSLDTVVRESAPLHVFFLEHATAPAFIHVHLLQPSLSSNTSPGWYVMSPTIQSPGLRAAHSLFVDPIAPVTIQMHKLQPSKQTNGAPPGVYF